MSKRSFKRALERLHVQAEFVGHFKKDADGSYVKRNGQPVKLYNLTWR